MPLSTLQQNELDMWKEWKKTKNNSLLNKLVSSYQPIVNTTLKKYQSAPLPKTALEALSKSYIVKGLETYDPGRGTQLNTHLYNYQKGIFRDVTQHVNIVRIPEHRVRKVGLYQNVFNHLYDRMGREPTGPELSDELGWDIKEVERMSKELSKDVLSSQGSDFMLPFQSFDDFGKNKELLEMLYYDLNPEEKIVYEYLYGVGGKPEITGTKDMARALRTTEDKVRTIKRKIADKFERTAMTGGLL